MVKSEFSGAQRNALVLGFQPIFKPTTTESVAQAPSPYVSPPDRRGVTL